MTGYAPQMLTHAKSLRRDMTDAERKLWKILRDRQLHAAKFRRQQPVSPYLADFVCQDVRLIVEIDGGQHNDNAYDRRRDTWLNEAGYRVLRLWNNEVLENIDGVAARIIAALHSPPSPTSPRPQAAKASYPLPQGERSNSNDGASLG